MQELLGDMFNPDTYRIFDKKLAEWVRWEDKSDVTAPHILCITTNGHVNSNGLATMGRGCARRADELFGNGLGVLRAILGRAIMRYGNKVRRLTYIRLPGRTFNTSLISFPVKPSTVVVNDDGMNTVESMRYSVRPGETLPGWAAVASLSLIRKSALELTELVDLSPAKMIILPRPGCGAGELEWKDVKPILQEILDDRFYCITYR
jgi:hypothetical protein